MVFLSGPDAVLTMTFLRSTAQVLYSQIERTAPARCQSV